MKKQIIITVLVCAAALLLITATYLITIKSREITAKEPEKPPIFGPNFVEMKIPDDVDKAWIAVTTIDSAEYIIIVTPRKDIKIIPKPK